MRYRPETTKKRSTINPYKHALGWIIGFPGYVILIACWLGVLVSLMTWLMSLLNNSESQNQAVSVVMPASQITLLQAPPALIWILGAASAGALLFFYWLIVKFAKQIVQVVANHFDKPVIAVKLISLVIGCVGSAIMPSLARHDLGALPLIVSSWALGVGILSFVLEYVIIEQ